MTNEERADLQQKLLLYQEKIPKLKQKLEFLNFCIQDTEIKIITYPQEKIMLETELASYQATYQKYQKQMTDIEAIIKGIEWLLEE